MFRSLVSSTGRLPTALNVSRQAGLAQLNVAQRTYAGWSPASTTYKKPASPSASPSTSSSSSKPGYSSAARTTNPPPIEEAAAEFDTAPVSSAASQAPLIKVSEGGSAEENGQDWASSFFGLSTTPFSKEAAEVLMRPVKPEDIECKPDGLIYLPEIKYRRILNEAFGPGGWGLAPRGNTDVTAKNVSREWGLICLGRLVSVARGEQAYFDPSGVPTAIEACKSNALMRCCKDLGIASELWDPHFVREYKAKHCKEVFVEHVTTKKVRKLWRKNNNKFEYPYKEKTSF